MSMNLNVESWKEFKLTDVFIVRGGFYNKKPEHEVEGNIPFLASTETNNGVTEYYSIDDIIKWDKTGNINNTLSQKIYKGNCIAVTVNGSVCNAFYQAEDFTCSHDITALYPIDHTFTKSQALFICTVIMKEKYRWSYGRKPHDVKKFGKSIIKLPVTTSNNVDWDFMERYIKSLNYKPLTTQNSNPQQPLNIDSWQEFLVSNIFEIYNGKFITKEEIDENPGDFCAVQSGEENNGVLGKIDKQYCIDKGYIYTDQPCLTVARSGSAGYVSYQNFGCVVGDSAKILLLKDSSWRTPYIYLFIKTLLMANKFKYTYGRKVTEDKYLIEIINLPVKLTREGDIMIDTQKKYSAKGFVPDFEFMENYIKSLPYGDRI